MSPQNRLVVVVATLSFLVAMSLLGCRRQSPPAPKPTTLGVVSSASVPVDGYVGTPACAECHAEIAHTHGASRHMQTLTGPTQSELGGRLPTLGKVPNWPFQAELSGEALQFRSTDPKEPPVAVALALGSGKTGMTYVQAQADTLVEISRSFYLPTQVWYTTPGQEALPTASAGKAVPAEIARKCILCHAVTLPPKSLAVERRFLGVGCEACHGPGEKHIAAQRSGKPDPSAMRSLKNIDGDRLNDLCGKCHRTADTVSVNNEEYTQTNRFQPYGLSMSRCFIQSKGKLSCTTCHNPHEDASTDTKRYDTTCLRCHGKSESVPIVAAKPCPVNATEKCVSCHMPRRPVFAHSQVPTTMADHFIRVFKPGSSGPAAH